MSYQFSQKILFYSLIYVRALRRVLYLVIHCFSIHYGLKSQNVFVTSCLHLMAYVMKAICFHLLCGKTVNNEILANCSGHHMLKATYTCVQGTFRITRTRDWREISRRTF